MHLAVVAYPALEDAHRGLIEAFRAKHDPQSARVAVHFTLVFPFQGSSDTVLAEIAPVASATAPISFTVRRTQMVSDAFGHGHQVFLVPDEGAAEISALHDRLYGGALKIHLRSDIPFVPHMTVGAAPDSASALRLATEFEQLGQIIRGTVEVVALLDVGTRRVQGIASWKLTGRPFNEE